MGAEALEETPFKVLHVAQPTVDGVAGSVAALVRDQVSSGWSVLVACPPEGALAKLVEAAGASHLSWAARREPGPSTLIETLRLSSLIRHHGPTLLHLHSSKAGLAGRLASRGRVATIFQPRGWSFLAVTGTERFLALAWERFAVRWADAIVCVSEGELNVAASAGVEGRWRVVPNQVDTNQFQPASDEQRTSARSAIGAHGRIVLCVGRLSAQKGQDVLVGAWPRVLEAVPDAELILVGDGQDRADIAKALPARARLVGRQSDVIPWLHAADVIAAPSRWEGHSRAILEAMSCGKSIVASNVPGMRESLGSAGAIVPPDDAEALATAVIARLSDDDLRRRDGEESRRRAVALFAMPARSGGVAEVYADVLRERAGSGHAS